MKLALTILSAGLLTAELSAAHAAVVVVAPTAATPGSFTITNDITFNIANSGSGVEFVLENWVTSDGSITNSPFSPGLSLSINGAATTSVGTGNFLDNSSSQFGVITANSGYFYPFSLLSLNAGDTVTLKSQSYTLGAVAGFNPQGSQVFTGNMYIASSGVSPSRLSNIVSAGAVPEPSTWAMLATAGVGLLLVVRRSRAHTAPA